MSRRFGLTPVFVFSAMALAFSVSAQAGAGRTFVSTTGNDSNTAVNCSASANCRTFAAALGVTNPGGEIVVVNSGGYGPATINQPVVISAIGIVASVSAPSGDGLSISTTGAVTIIGLNLHGEGSGTDGISVTQVGFLRLYNVFAERFMGNGVNFDTSGKMAIYDSRFNDDGNDGVLVQNSGAQAYIHNTSFDHNSNGVEASAGFATIADSDAHANSIGFLADGGTLTVANNRIIYNGVGMETSASASSKMYFANCLISNNATAYNVGASSTMSGTNPGTSLIAPNQTLTGTLTSAIALQ